MIKLSISQDWLEGVAANSRKALRSAINKTAAIDCKVAIYQEMQDVFDRPTRYTLNSLQSTGCKGSDLTAHVWFRDPDRMQEHYLVPQVDGGARKLKGFEHALDRRMFIPGAGVRRDRYGNVSAGQIRQILSVLGAAERYAGYTANASARSLRRNKKSRDYIYLPNGLGGSRLPGVYQRVGGKKKNRKGAAVAGSLIPILIMGRQFAAYRPRLNFYKICQDIFIDKINGRYVEALQMYQK